jgi:hypothetical protein
MEIWRKNSFAGINYLASLDKILRLELSWAAVVYHESSHMSHFEELFFASFVMAIIDMSF